MPATVTEEMTEQKVDESAAELPEFSSSQLVFDHSAQYQPTICPSASERA